MAQNKENSFDAFLLSTPTIKELTEHVDVSTDWYIVGTMLDLDQKSLRNIERQTGHTDTHKMIEMFNLWLATAPTASRRQVLETLKKSVVGENTLADEYEKHLKEMHKATCKISSFMYAVIELYILGIYIYTSLVIKISNIFFP